jgi:hypothetical protein
LLVALAVLLPARVTAETWSRRYIAALPDSAFAAVETTADGHKLRHLPHHDRYGHLDVPHVRNALTRVTQVHWADPRHAAAARAHLLRHLRALRSRRGSGLSSPAGLHD